MSRSDTREAEPREQARAIFQQLTGVRVGDRQREGFFQAWDTAVSQLEGDVARALRKLTAGSRDILAALAATLSVPESYFFRGIEGWNSLREFALPAWGPGRTRRVWSVGCARGEEPQTLALIGRGFFPAGTKVQVIATEMSPALVADARASVYSDWSLRALPSRYEECFEPHAGQRKLRHIPGPVQVEYRQHQLLIDGIPEEFSGGVDLILCRNMLIYLDESAVRRAFQLFHEALRPDGHMLLACADPWPSAEGWARVSRQSSLFSWRDLASIPPRKRSPSAPQASPEVRADWSAGFEEGPTPLRTSPPEDPVLKVRLLLGRGETNEALEALEAATVEAPVRADLWYLLGELRLLRGRTELAREALRRALFLEPEHPSALLALSRVLTQLGETAAGDRHRAQALAVASRLPEEAAAGAGADLSVAEVLRMNRLDAANENQPPGGTE